MSAMTRSPAWRSAGGSTSGIFGAASVTVIDATMAPPSVSCESADRPGRQIHRHDRDGQIVDVGDDGFEQPGELAVKTGTEQRVHEEVALRDFREMQLPLLRIR